MKKFIFIACLLLAASHGRADDDVDEKDVFIFTDKNFNETISKAKYALVRSAWHHETRLNLLTTHTPSSLISLTFSRSG